MTREAARRLVAAAFAEAGLPSADLDARLLVCAAAGIEHAALIREPDVPLGAAGDRLAEFAARRLRREPVSRILGCREFHGFALSIDGAVLDPRPETEGLVEVVLDSLRSRRDEPLRILDLGTGSGAILAALLRELPLAHGVGVDLSIGACRTASRNLNALGLGHRAGIVCGHWAEAMGERFDAVVSNPPYVVTRHLASLEPDVRDYDPIAALDGGHDGLDAYRALIPVLDGVLQPEGLAVLECGAGQGAAVAALMGEAGLGGAAVLSDLAGHDRVVTGRAREKR